MNCLPKQHRPCSPPLRPVTGRRYFPRPWRGSVMGVAVGLAVSAAPCLAQAEEPVRLKVTKLRGGISMIEGDGGFAGGNVGVSVGEDGLFIIDDELEKMSGRLQAALQTISKHPVRFVINTHFHGDHSGGNQALATRGAIVVAHENARTRLREARAEERAEPKTGMVSGLPVVTFDKDVTLHLNGDTVHVIHMPPAHTDGDAIVHFEQANVIHTGDLFLSSGYPFVDLDHGGSFDGFLEAADRILALCNAETRVIPGHGEIVDGARVKAWRDNLAEVRRRVVALMQQGKTLEQIVAAKPTQDIDAQMGQNFISAERIVTAVFQSLNKAPKKP